MATPTLDELRASFAAAFDDAPTRELNFNAMFGGACAYVNGRVFASLSNVGLALKTDAARAVIWLEHGGKWLQPEEDAPVSNSHVVAPDAVLKDGAELARWAQHSVGFVLSLPAPKARAKKRA